MRSSPRSNKLKRPKRLGKSAKKPKVSAKSSSETTKRLLSTNAVTLVSETGSTELDIQTISWENVGQKAYGLSALPPAWTLPFFVISPQLLHDYRKRKKAREKTLASWMPAIRT